MAVSQYAFLSVLVFLWTCEMSSVVTQVPKPLEGKPVTISRKSVTAKANASGLAVSGKGDQKLFF